MIRKKELSGSGKSNRGGFREGSGRPVGKGRTKGEPTQMMRVPLSRKEAVKRLIETQEYRVPIFIGSVRAGAPTDVPDEYPERVGLVSYLTAHPEGTFLIKAEGDSMINANICDGDVLVVDGMLEAKDGAIIVASVNGDQTVKRLRKINGQTYLYPENKQYSPISIEKHTDLKIWGVVKKKICDVG